VPSIVLNSLSVHDVLGPFFVVAYESPTQISALVLAPLIPNEQVL
jgi:hypothetical protein